MVNVHAITTKSGYLFVTDAELTEEMSNHLEWTITGRTSIGFLYEMFTLEQSTEILRKAGLIPEVK